MSLRKGVYCIQNVGSGQPWVATSSVSRGLLPLPVPLRTILSEDRRTPLEIIPIDDDKYQLRVYGDFVFRDKEDLKEPVKISFEAIEIEDIWWVIERGSSEGHFRIKDVVSEGYWTRHKGEKEGKTVEKYGEGEYEIEGEGVPVG
ncbi:hypothetical protein RHS02_01214, partial [Rhizoctonia solani]